MKQRNSLGKLAPPLREGQVFLFGRFVSEQEFSASCAYGVEADDYNWRTDPDYDIAERLHAQRERTKQEEM